MTGKDVQQLSFEAEVWDDSLIDSYDVVKGSLDVEGKIQLVGVPFLITKVFYREGMMQNGVQKDFVTLECVTAPETRYDRSKILKYRKSAARKLTVSDVEELGYTETGYTPPLSHVVINDSGTGIRRQITAYLVARQRVNIGIDVPAELFDKLDGELGSSPFDKPVSEWPVSDSQAEAQDGLDVRIRIDKGLRLSAYTAQATGQPAATFYLG